MRKEIFPPNLFEDRLTTLTVSAEKPALASLMKYRVTVSPVGERRVALPWSSRTILPFENTLVTLRIRGAKLPPAARSRLAAVEPERVYTVATKSHVAGHLSRYFPDGVEGRVESGRSMRDTVIEHVIERGTIE